MIGRIEDIRIISSFKNESNPYKKIISRKSHGFVYRIKGRAEYKTEAGTFVVNEGEMAFLPKGAAYELTSYNSIYTSINFEASVEFPEITVYSLKEYSGAHSMLQGFSEIWNFGNQSDKYKCLSELYELLSYITRTEHLEGNAAAGYRIIEPALAYLKSHIFDPDLRVARLHNLCGISDTYLRKLFTSRFSMTPREYIQRERLAHARHIIESGDYDCIRTVAESVGYVDPLYFSKAFKKQYGFSPSALCE